METEKPRILIADGEEHSRLLISRALRMEEYEIESALNGQNALQLLEDREFDLLLLDLGVPDMDGVKVLRRVVELCPNVRVVIMTAHGTVGNAVEAVKLGAEDFIQKPFSAQEIRALLAQILDRQHRDEQQAEDYTTHLELSRQGINEHRLEAATEHVRRAIADDPARPEAFNLMGVLEEMRGNHHAAMTNYRVALDLDPTYSPAHENLQNSSDLAGHRPHSFNLG